MENRDCKTKTYRNVKVKQHSDDINYAVNTAYDYGYNTVLKAAENVLSKENYLKLIKYLKENGKRNCY